MFFVCYCGIARVLGIASFNLQPPSCAYDVSSLFVSSSFVIWACTESDRSMVASQDFAEETDRREGGSVVSLRHQEG